MYDEFIFHEGPNYLFIDWMLGNTCNFSCSYCDPNVHNGTTPWIDIKQIDGLVTQIKNVYTILIKNLDSFIKPSRDYIASNFSRGYSNSSKYLHNQFPTLSTRMKYGRESVVGSNIMFIFLLIILILFLVWLPISDSDNMNFNKTLQVSNVLLTLSIFILMSFSLNLHTGITGMVNFGVIFFVGNLHGKSYQLVHHDTTLNVSQYGNL